ncbi:trypsin-like peptidase domain-containing protein [Corynebacterium halotolerans]|uniref:trypsin-like peptidase domain-containing protein n=1 Tax=Corynebacterium halotolerans TaxID=225326 RepID=UPI00034929C4|nr:trypsin-like peptidase domain-containing protein [Corynebacterium halotolerans]
MNDRNAGEPRPDEGEGGGARPTPEPDSPGTRQSSPGQFESVRSPYQSWPQTQPRQAPGTQQGYWGPVPDAEPEPAEGRAARSGKRSVGLGTALALMLVAAVVTGSVVGLVAANTGGSNAVVNSLREPNAEPAPVPEGGSVVEVADQVLPTVVSIQVATRTAAGEGSGSIISSDGYVLTNHHVIAGAEQGGVIQVTMNDGTTHPAEFVASDPATDIAVIRIQDVSDLPTIQFGDSSELRVGQQVVAVGSPLGLSSTVTTGIVSAMNRPVRASDGGGESSLIDAIQTDAAINPGNSGGPLVDMNGNLIGMNSVIASLSSGDQAGSIGLGFAIPSNFAKRVADQLITTGEASQPMLGVTVARRGDVDGALIAGVEEGGPGDQAGLAPGDVVTRLNDRNIDSSDALIAATRSHDFGETVTLTVTQPDSGQTRQVEVTLTTE